MSFDKRFYGIYSAVIADAEDPEDLGRVKLIIPQVLGNNITEWCYGTGGVAVSNVNSPYGTFITTATQTVSGANTATLVSSWQDEDVNKMYSSGTRIYAEETGDYLIVWSAMLNKSNASNAEVDIWVRVNGQNLANSNTRGHLFGSDAETVLTDSSIVDLKAGEYFEFVFSSADANVKIQYYGTSSSPTRPAVPGVIATANLIGKWRPQPGTKAWAMFEAGDPNFPVWMGALS
jgi:hypothetical protein